MRKLLSISLIILAVFIVQIKTNVAKADDVKISDLPKRILFIGNSYFYRNDSLHTHVKAMVEAGIPELSKGLDYKSATIGGAELYHHDIDWLTTPGRIGVNKPFELVILAGNSGDALKEASAKKFRETVIRFDKVIRARGAKTALYMVHTYVAPNKEASPDNITKVSKLYTAVGQEIGALVLPVGLAFTESYKRRPDLVLHDLTDGSHPSLYGTYLAACVVYAEVYHKSPIGNSYDMHGRVPADIKSYLQQVAWDVVQGYGNGGK